MSTDIGSTTFSRIIRDRAGSDGKLVPILDLGNQYLNRYLDSSEEDVEDLRAPINLAFCPQSHLFQYEVTVNRPALYNEYWYKSGINPVMVHHLRDTVKYALQFVDLQADDVVLDIASNDGTLLRQYENCGHRHVFTVGYDPALNLQDEAREKVSEHFATTFDAEHYHMYVQKAAKIITACAVLYHADNPRQFLKDVDECLAPDGVFVCEFSWLPFILHNTAFDSLGHEHLMHLSLYAVDYMIADLDLEIVDVQLLDKHNSGALRVAMRRPDADPDDYESNRCEAWVRAMFAYEEELKIPSVSTYTDFAIRVEVAAQIINEHIKFLAEGNSIAVYGASTKGSILLQTCSINSDMIDYAIERDKRKFGKYMIGTGIPIISEDDFRSRHKQPDYLLVLPWHFRDAFIYREREFLKEGGQMIFPLPKFEIVDASALS